MRIAITGGIGSGKSFVCRLLHERGIDVFNCDITAKMIIATHPEVRDELTALISSEQEHSAASSVIGAAGSESSAVPILTKQSLGDYIRRGPDFAGRVNAIVHPRVAEAFLASEQQWMECAILFESGFDRLVDHVVVVTCPTEERIRRVMARDNCDETTARRWLALQMTDEERIRRATETQSLLSVITNDGNTPIEPQLDALLKTLGDKPAQ